MAVAPIDDNTRQGLIAVSDVDGDTIVPLYADPVTHRLLVDMASGSLAPLTATGTVNGVNTAFVFTEQPTYIVVDGLWYSRLDNNGVAQWTWNGGTLTATMVVAPTNSIFGFVT